MAGIDQELKTIKLRNINTGKLINTLAGHHSYVWSVAFNLDGQNLASASADYTIKLWHIITGQELYTLGNHSDWVNSVAFSPDGKILVSSS
ncbi:MULTISPECIES: hypothetical protein [unclassified Nostoc]|uniref:WD40 repeat domain-containing protein n=1 Tax=unclassified Nostoc TaxID=2593658 RepID=UPI002AD37694|nr:hypothetical protein [Nostoc sp. DedQUE03]MDZ7971624.1 hypothetical protein [Nostoc sp. DedQUE03]MDZ8046181.1 hypothetical protein [Nostoc sp. DedQUE02]